MLVQTIKKMCENIFSREHSAKKFAVTVCLGVYIGISPFIGFHTIMTFLFAWLFALNTGTLFAVSFLIHNPWTTIPIYAFDHFFGKWLFRICNVDYSCFDPVWVDSWNDFLMNHTGISGVSPVAFLVGGNLLALIMSVIMYPLAKRLFEVYRSKKVI